MAKKNVATQIKKLLERLRKSEDKTEKSKIRAKLRKLGHRGGLNLPKKKAAKKKPTKKAKKKKVKNK